jgi:hypothetical protein
MAMNEREKNGTRADQNPPKKGAGDPGEDPRMSMPASETDEVRITSAPVPPPPPKNTGDR